MEQFGHENENENARKRYRVHIVKSIPESCNFRKRFHKVTILALTSVHHCSENYENKQVSKRIKYSYRIFFLVSVLFLHDVDDFILNIHKATKPGVAKQMNKYVNLSKATLMEFVLI